jgi:hypothetical protein
VASYSINSPITIVQTPTEHKGRATISFAVYVVINAIIAPAVGFALMYFYGHTAEVFLDYAFALGIISATANVLQYLSNHNPFSHSNFTSDGVHKYGRHGMLRFTNLYYTLHFSTLHYYTLHSTVYTLHLFTLHIRLQRVTYCTGSGIIEHSHVSTASTRCIEKCRPYSHSLQQDHSWW